MTEADAASRPALEERIVPIEAVRPWKDNPRIIRKADFDRLRNQIQNLGMYKRLLCAPDPDEYGYAFHGEAEKFIVAGGNMRLRILEEMGAPEVAITIVRPRDEAQLIEFSLSDNDSAGEYDTQAVAEQIYRNRDKIEISNYKIAVARPSDIEVVLSAFGPGLEGTEEDDQIPDLAAESDVEIGDLFDLGRHRLICGDAATAPAYKAVMGSKCICPHCGAENEID